jgi:cysteine synthase
MLKEDLGEIKEKGQTVVESSSGNTAKASTDFICRAWTKIQVGHK